MKWSLICAIVVGLILCAAVVLVYLNRASEKIVSAALPIATGAILALALSIFVFGSVPTQFTRFFTAYTLVTESKRPSPEVAICKENGEFALNAYQQIIAPNPQLLNNSKDPNAIQLYNHLLQWEILRRISMMSRKHWRTEMFTSKLYRFRSAELPDDADPKQVQSKRTASTV